MARGGRGGGAPASGLAAGGGRNGQAALAAAVNVPQPAAASSPDGRPVYGAGAALAADRSALPSTPTSAAPTAPQPTGVQVPTILPGQIPSPTAPSQRPTEPVTAGLSSGPGAGPEALSTPNMAVQQWQTGHDAIQALASASGASPALQTLAARLGVQF